MLTRTNLKVTVIGQRSQEKMSEVPIYLADLA